MIELKNTILRYATKTQNTRNSSISKANKTGIIGVHASSKDTWRVSIQRKVLGKRYKNFTEAIIDRLKLEKEIYGGFTSAYAS